MMGFPILNNLAHHVPGSYVIVYHDHTDRLRVEAYADFSHMANRLARVWVNTRSARNVAATMGKPIPCGEFEVVSPTGKLMNIDPIVKHGQRLWEQQRLQRWFPGYVRRQGPVHGIGRYGGFSAYRTIHVMSEHRQANLVLVGEGEVAPRSARSNQGLPDTWEAYRHRERTWKSQHRGRKAWDKHF